MSRLATRSRYAPLPASATPSTLRAALHALDISADVEAPAWLREPDRLRRLLRRQAHLDRAAARIWWRCRLGWSLDRLETDAGL